MKKVFLFCFVLVPILIHAQYIPLLQYGKKWIYAEGISKHNENWNSNWEGLDFVYLPHSMIIHSDTIINDKKYFILYQDGELNGFMREDLQTHKVYIIPREQCSGESTTEVLMYDFSANVGDVIYTYNGKGLSNYFEQKELLKNTVTSVDTIDGKRRLLLSIDVKYNCDKKEECTTTFNKVYWVEGVGGFSGLNKIPFTPVCDKSGEFIPLCVYERDHIFFEEDINVYQLQEGYFGSPVLPICVCSCKATDITPLETSRENCSIKSIVNGSLQILLPDGRRFDTLGREIK